VLKNEAKAYKSSDITCESDFVEYCRERVNTSVMASLMRILARGSWTDDQESEAASGGKFAQRTRNQQDRRDNVIPEMITELLYKGIHPNKKYAASVFAGQIASVNGLTVNAHALLAKLFAIASRDSTDTALRESAEARMDGRWGRAEARALFLTIFDNVGFRKAGGKWKQLTLLVRLMYSEAELTDVGYFDAGNEAPGLVGQTVGLTEDTYRHVQEAELRYIATAIRIAPSAPRSKEESPVSAPLPKCTTSVFGRKFRGAMKLRRDKDWESEKDKQLSGTKGLFSLMRGVRHVDILEADIAKKVVVRDILRMESDQVTADCASVEVLESRRMYAGSDGSPSFLAVNGGFYSSERTRGLDTSIALSALEPGLTSASDPGLGSESGLVLGLGPALGPDPGLASASGLALESTSESGPALGRVASAVIAASVPSAPSASSTAGAPSGASAPSALSTAGAPSAASAASAVDCGVGFAVEACTEVEGMGTFSTSVVVGVFSWVWS
jgi:hypothetical protein